MSSPDRNPPAQVLTRTIRVALFNGWSVAGVSLFAAGASLIEHDTFGAIVCFLVALVGGLEIQGARMLRQGRIRGMTALVCSQLMILSVVLGFTAGAFASVGPNHVVGRVPIHYVQTLISQAHMTPLAALNYLATLLKIAYAAIGITVFLYQGGMAVYYQRQAPVIERLLASGGH